LEKYCSQYGVGYENFRKRFRLKIGVSPGRYIINRRIDAACEMLRMSKTPISEIAFSLGYASPFEFSAQFKKTIGISPNHYRR
jgi:AraC-like DNA-binding protein